MFAQSQFAGTQAVFNITSTQNAISLTSDNKGVMNLAQTELIAYPGASGHIDIPASVTTIRNNAFCDCSSLTSVNIPESVTTIGSQAFYNCSSLISVNLLPTTPPSIGNNTFANNASGRTFYIPKNTYAAYSTATNWSVYASFMEEVI